MRRDRGFTLVEVMASLAILAIALTWILQRSLLIVREVEQSRLRSAATMLAQHALWEVEEQLRKDGFQETSQDRDWEDFEEEGWPQIRWKAEVRKAELPSPEQLAAMAQQQAQAEAEAAAAAAAGAGAGTGTGVDPAVAAAAGGGGLLGVMSMFGGGMTAEDVDTAGFMGGGGYAIIQQVFEAAIRKIVMTVEWKALGETESFQLVYYVTDPDAMNRVIGGAAGADAEAYGAEPTGVGGGNAPTNPTGGGGGNRGGSSGGTGAVRGGTGGGTRR